MSWTDVADTAVGGLPVVGGIWSNIQNRAESKKARQWTAEMAGSSVQRHMIDLKAAGLNPILAAGGMAQTPSPATASVDDVIGPGVSTALQAREQRKRLELLDQQIQKTKYEASSASSDARVRSLDGDMAQSKYLYYFNSDGTPKPALEELLRAEFGQSVASSARALSEAKLAELSVPERQAVARLFEQFGSGAKGVQMLLPLLMTLMRR